MMVGGVGVGIFGSLLGLGGGLLIVPLLNLGFHLPLREAIGVSLVCVIVTSGASASVFLERRVANLRLGMTLELFTAMGALVGGLVAFLLDERVLAGLFAGLLVYVAATMVRPRPKQATPAHATESAGGAGGAGGPPRPPQPMRPARRALRKRRPLAVQDPLSAALPDPDITFIDSGSVSSAASARASRRRSWGSAAA